MLRIASFAGSVSLVTVLHDESIHVHVHVHHGALGDLLPVYIFFIHPTKLVHLLRPRHRARSDVLMSLMRRPQRRSVPSSQTCSMRTFSSPTVGLPFEMTRILCTPAESSIVTGLVQHQAPFSQDGRRNRGNTCNLPPASTSSRAFLFSTPPLTRSSTL